MAGSKGQTSKSQGHKTVKNRFWLSLSSLEERYGHSPVPQVWDVPTCWLLWLSAGGEQIKGVVDAACRLDCHVLSMADYVDFLLTTLSEFPGNFHYVAML